MLSLKKYARTVVARFAEFLPVKSHVPLDSVKGLERSVLMGPDMAAGQAIMAKLPYRQLLSSLMYLLVSTRPDLGLPRLRRLCVPRNLGREHRNASLKILANVAISLEAGLLY